MVRQCCIPSLAQQLKQMLPHNNENKTITMEADVTMDLLQ
jgi:hypothetical protein